jgi:hypothetical protein
MANGNPQVGAQLRRRQVSIPNAPDGVSYVEDFFVYEAQTLALAALTSIPVNIQVQADSDFKLLKLTQFSDIATAVQTESTRVVPLVTLQLTDTGSGRALFSSPVPMGALFGDGRLPFILPIVRIFKARSNINLVFANYSAATTYNIYIALIGTKLFQLT